MIDPHHLVGLPPETIRHRFERRDTILYALGVGAGQQGDERELFYVCEDRLVALPTMAVVLAYPGFWQMEPRYSIDWKQILHAEQSCDFYAPLPIEGHVRGELRIDAIVDKGANKGAFLRAERLIYSEPDNRLIARVRQISYLRGDGGCGSAGQQLEILPIVPDGPPDVQVTLATRPEQALLYRLSGDGNPLHYDPEVAKAAGFPSPILHGLCTYGYACRAILQAALPDNGFNLRKLQCRFTAPVYPGDRLEVEIWKTSDSARAFRVSVPARKTIVLDRGVAVFAEP
ncbi:3-alpha,7-alpha,12-alpha-trihydroxy-5-beta-cholest-24-enoyl-CoA hydratase [Altererythrobacter salegens]|uniref:3-alpha,7-alpha, 12-alpha-trihydroxy-5-beta-cholest-24-enoyl-CoA hydratase n=1 Tax=Croceibacterium salegens TaxID=1737568 RepID=A0A6I4SZJ7_9SPHN|nr:MaoC/PaaZ C-terminal domain-containing protein [Croceibacterium salegens]MXO60660.1 3-alpha,7-alpha,12-alpha-trihydroxy-5-beta-cholest-24-enoyl-CoA hydratase [Croceibacterium salegens]